MRVPGSVAAHEAPAEWGVEVGWAGQGDAGRKENLKVPVRLCR